MMTKKELLIALVEGMPPTQKSRFVPILLGLTNDDAIFDYVDATDALSIMDSEEHLNRKEHDNG